MFTVVLCLTFLLHAYARPPQVSELYISTTWEAEDAGLQPAKHPQCKAWAHQRAVEANKKTRPPSTLLPHIQYRVAVYTQRDAHYHRVPVDLLRKYTVITIDFERVCALHARTLWINSTHDVGALNMNRETLCKEYKSILYGDDEAAEEDNGNSTLYAAMSFISLVSGINNETSSANLSTNLLLPYLDDNGTLPTTILLRSPSEVEKLALGISPKYFHLHQSIGIKLKQACAEGAVTVLGKGMHGRIGEELAKLGFDALEISEIVESADDLDDILEMFEKKQVSEERPFPSTTLIPFLNRLEYDPRSPPSFYSGDKIIVRVGLHVQSISNFQMTTMDYEMDMWMRLAWRDMRLAHGLSKPILINEYTFLKKIWRPDPFFTNARQAVFHRVSYLNFYVYIFPNGNVLMDVRTALKNSCPLLVLCKYPHDSQSCGVKISSITLTNSTLEFQWFSRNKDAIRINSKLQMPELMLTSVETQQCNGNRKSGNYSCIEALFKLDRQVRFHLAQTYVPTTICVVFSWISVWLPEEFVEGRVFVSLTVFLTLSAENNSAKEDLPKVSYVKAIDYWFGFTSTFVFLTMLQALFVISFEHQSRSLKTSSLAYEDSNRYEALVMLMKSRKYHKWARNLDSFCKVMYPVAFLIFLMIYGFVITQGEEDKCLRKVWE